MHVYIVADLHFWVNNLIQCLLLLLMVLFGHLLHRDCLLQVRREFTWSGRSLLLPVMHLVILPLEDGTTVTLRVGGLVVPQELTDT